MTEPPPTDLQVDFPFDYVAHVSGERRIGRLPARALGTPVAVIGAGGSGLTAAYELLRIGCRPIVYEAETSAAGPGGRRLGGRMFSLRLAPDDSAVVELGCMRVPDSAKLLRQYTDRFGLHWLPFRDDYAAGTTPWTVLDVDGVTRAVREITDLYTDDDLFRRAHTRWRAALTRVGLFALQEAVAARDLDRTRRLWGGLVARFEPWTYYRFLRDPDGASLTWDEARLLGTAGVGTAAWDSFHDLGVLEVFRLLLATEGGGTDYLREGLSAVAEAFWAHRTTGPDGTPTSLAEVNNGAPRPGVTLLEVGETVEDGVVVHSEDGRAERFPAVVFTPQLHVLETSVGVRPLRPGGAAPFGVRMRRAIRRLSYWQSAKTALVTDTPFWAGTSMDGVTLTDRLPRAAYTMDYGEPAGPGGRRAVLVLSFTWAKDAMKIAPSTLDERVAVLTRELGRVHPDLAEELGRQVADGSTCTISWELERNFRGLCRFSRPGEHRYQWDLFAHFMKDFAGEPAIPGEAPNPLFLAGDDTSWSAGWLDHALSSGLNAAWGVLRCLGGQTLPDNPGPGDVWGDHRYRPVTAPDRPRPAVEVGDRADDRRDRVVTAARLWDGERMRAGREARVLVRDGRVEAVGADVAPPADAVAVDLAGHTLLPGLIDCHVHVLDDDLNTAPVGTQLLRALPNLRDLLAAGFTTVRDLGTSDYPAGVDLRDAVAAGLVEGPRLVVAPNILSASGGHGDREPVLTSRYGLRVGTLADGVQQVVDRVRAQARAGADWIKFAAGGGFLSPVDNPTAVTYSQSEIDALVAAATDLGLPCAVHALNDEAVRRSVRAGVRSVEHANLATPETFALLARQGVFLVPTLHAVFRYVDRLDDDEFWAGQPDYRRAKFRALAEPMRAAASHLADSEVTLVFGTDACPVPYRETWREFTAMTRVGISPGRALAAATGAAADLLRRPDLGRVRPGAVADLVAVPGDPLADIAVMGEVDFVMRAGAVRTARP
ncbi:amidohydrolase family protein [Actinosynnema sp. NPDC047251]|uniref:Uncharacterized protein n=1 Tax=Saccharothrix espanaensis (strain ATCC 51144 / DSM 44229 / JCM 9112 / NBRC 15066 / NRRL 15764) TaxID=1179773 RepID=K0JT91_SACES|nr:amidohydrolase family protein [Saccharothrix espanaensis]CCH31000.1 hypothetical protein BN6_37070 [Saccharothrix espanaensis DSM 44229]